MRSISPEQRSGWSRTSDLRRIGGACRHLLLTDFTRLPTCQLAAVEEAQRGADHAPVHWPNRPPIVWQLEKAAASTAIGSTAMAIFWIEICICIS